MAKKSTLSNKPQKKFRNSGAQPLSTMHPDHPRRKHPDEHAFEAKSPTQRFQK